jgi:hypothetical protein
MEADLLWLTFYEWHSIFEPDPWISFWSPISPHEIYYGTMFLYFVVLEVLEFECRASHLLGTSPFLLWLFWTHGLTFCPGRHGLQSFYFKLPIVAGMTTCTAIPRLLFLEMGVSLCFPQPGLEVLSGSQPQS